DRGVERRDLARYDGLQGLDDARRREDGIHGLVGHGAVAAGALDLDRELVHGRHEGAAVEADLPDRDPAPEVEPENGLDALEGAIAHTGLGAALAFLGGLMEESQ